MVTNGDAIGHGVSGTGIICAGKDENENEIGMEYGRVGRNEDGYKGR